MTKRILLAMLLVAVVAGAWPWRAVLDRGDNGQLLWHDDEAFLFLNVSRIGWNASTAYTLLGAVGAFGGPSQDLERQVRVYRITSTAAEQVSGYLGTVDQLIVANGYISTGTARWTGRMFEGFMTMKLPAAFVRPGAVLKPEGIPWNDFVVLEEFSEVEGWSKRTASLSSDRFTIDFQLKGRPARLVTTRDGQVWAIDVEREGMASTRLLEASDRPRRVSRAEYRASFVMK